MSLFKPQLSIWNESWLKANTYFSDPPEIEIEQNWYERDGVVEVEIICVVHANPEAEVVEL